MRKLVLGGSALLGVVVAMAVVAGGPAQRTATAERARSLTPWQQHLLSGTASRALDESTAQQRQEQTRPATGRTNETGCPANRGSNVRVNQECQNLADPDLAGRSQAQNETAIAQDPRRPNRMVGAANDYRRGDSGCYTYFSSDNGRTWQDSTPPLDFTRGTTFGGFARQYWEAAGDPSVAWDTKGNAYLSCLTFQRGTAVTSNPDRSSAFYVLRSTGTGGASWNFPARPVAEYDDTAGAGNALLDKQYMTIDDHRGSPFQDRIYVSWTFFAPDGTAYIFLAYSSDYGESFSSPTLVSRDSPACGDTHGVPTPQGRCNSNQFSQPFTGPDGALYVAWTNYNAANTGNDNRNQMLLAKSTDGGASFSSPVKVGDSYELPDCVTYQGASAGVSCVPEKGETTNSIFRAANYPSGSVNPRDPREVIVSFGSYLNRHSNEDNGCVPAGVNPETFQPRYEGVKTVGACNNDVVISRSTDAGASFTGTTEDVRELPSARDDDPRADQFWQWATFDPRGRFAVSYYDRGYGNDELTGFSDYSLSGSRNGEDFATRRVTTGSMPPASQFGGGFFGDYSGISAKDERAHPIWADTRDPELFACRDSGGNVTLPPSVCTAPAANAEVANDQNVYTRSLEIPTP